MSLWFLCSHKHTTFPITLPERARKSAGAQAAARTPHTYMTCLDCGKEIPYSWEQMRVLPRRLAFIKSAATETASVAH
jgi:RNA polymerase-binding transcription factor DksA